MTCISCARGENNAVFWANDEKEIRKYNGNCYKLAANLWDLWNNKRQTLRLNVYRFFSILLWRNGEKKKTEDFIDVKFYCEGNFSVKIYEFSKLNFLCLCDAEWITMKEISLLSICSSIFFFIFFSKFNFHFRCKRLRRCVLTLTMSEWYMFVRFSHTRHNSNSKRFISKQQIGKWWRRRRMKKKTRKKKQRKSPQTHDIYNNRRRNTQQ